MTRYRATLAFNEILDLTSVFGLLDKMFRWVDTERLARSRPRSHPLWARAHLDIDPVDVYHHHRSHNDPTLQVVADVD